MRSTTGLTRKLKRSAKRFARTVHALPHAKRGSMVCPKVRGRTVWSLECCRSNQKAAAKAVPRPGCVVGEPDSRSPRIAPGGRNGLLRCNPLGSADNGGATRLSALVRHMLLVGSGCTDRKKIQHMKIEIYNRCRACELGTEPVPDERGFGGRFQVVPLMTKRAQSRDPRGSRLWNQRQLRP
jgi:hypothetical protein